MVSYNLFKGILLPPTFLYENDKIVGFCPTILNKKCNIVGFCIFCFSSYDSYKKKAAGKPHPLVCLGHAQSRRDSLMRWAQWATVKKSWFFKKLHRQRPNPCRNSSNHSPGWLFLVNLEKMSVKSSILLTFFLVFSVFYIFEGLSTPQNSILWKFADKISKINKFYQRRKIIQSVRGLSTV